MPKLLQDNKFVQREGLRLESPEAAAGPGLALARAGENQRAMAGRLEDNANVAIQKAKQAAAAHARFASAAHRADVNSRANDAMVRASQTFMELTNQRLQQTTDRDGQPTYATLSQDLMEIGRTIGKTYGKLGNKDASAKFGQMFGSFLADRTPAILQEQRSQQVQFAKASLLKNVDSIKAMGGNDDLSSWPAYEQQLTNLLRDGIADGTISPLDAYGLEKDARAAIVEQGLNKAIWDNPERLIMQLSSGTPEDFGATAAQYNSAIEMAQARVLQRRDAAEKEKKEKETKAATAHKAMLDATIDRHVMEFEAGNLDNLEEAKKTLFMDQSLDDATRATYSNKLRAAELKRGKEGASVNAVIESVQSGEILAGVSKKDIDGAYKQLTIMAAQSKGAPLEPEEEAMIVGKIRGTSPAYVAKLSAVAATGTPEEKVAHARAFQYLAKNNFQALKGMDETAKAMFTKINQDVDAGLSDPLRAVEHAEKFLLDTDPKVKAEIEKVGWRDGKDYAVGILGDAGMGVETLDETSPIRFDIARKYQHNLEVAKGDAAVARALTVDHVKQTYGESGVTEAMTSGIVFTSGTPVRTPPEMVAGVNTGNPIEMDALRGDLEDTLLDAANIPEGYDIDDVIYTPIDIMGSAVNAPEGTQAYSLAVVTDDGKLIDLRKDDGELLYWGVQPGTHSDRIVNQQAQVDVRGLPIEEVQTVAMPKMAVRSSANTAQGLKMTLNAAYQRHEQLKETIKESEVKGVAPSPKLQNEYKASAAAVNALSTASQKYAGELTELQAMYAGQIDSSAGSLDYVRGSDGNFHKVAPGTGTHPAEGAIVKTGDTYGRATYKKSRGIVKGVSQGDLSFGAPEPTIDIDPNFTMSDKQEHEFYLKWRDNVLLEKKRVTKELSNKPGGAEFLELMDALWESDLLFISIAMEFNSPHFFRGRSMEELDKMSEILEATSRSTQGQKDILQSLRQEAKENK